jgi:hypothetical protein
MNIVPVPAWGLSIHGASYYGYRFALHVGRRLVFLWPVKP